MAAGLLTLALTAACPGPESGSGDEAGDTGEEPDCEFGCDNCSEVHLWTCECYAVPNFVPVSPAWHTYPCPGCSGTCLELRATGLPREPHHEHGAS